MAKIFKYIIFLCVIIGLLTQYCKKEENVIKTRPIEQQILFSPQLLELYPGIYADLANKDTSAKFNVLQKAVLCNGITGKDIDLIVNEIILNAGKDLSFDQKMALCFFCNGSPFVSADGKIRFEQKPTKSPLSAKAYLKHFLNDSDEGIRSVAVTMLAGFKDYRYKADILNLMHDNSDLVKANVIGALGMLKVTEIQNDIKLLLLDNSVQIRKAAISYIELLEMRDHIPNLISLLEKEEWHAIQNNVLLLLGKWNAQDAIKSIMPILNRKEDPSGIRSNAIWALQQMKAKEAVNEIMALAKDEDYRVRIGVASFIGEMNVNDGMPILIKMCNDEIVAVRIQVVLSLGLFEFEGRIEQLKLLLEDRDQLVRGWAAIVLLELGFSSAETAKFKNDIIEVYIKYRFGNRGKTALQKIGVSNEEIEEIVNKYSE